MSTEEGEQFAKENGLVFMEASAKTAQNVEEVSTSNLNQLAKYLNEFYSTHIHKS